MRPVRPLPLTALLASLAVFALAACGNPQSSPASGSNPGAGGGSVAGGPSPQAVAPGSNAPGGTTGSPVPGTAPSPGSGSPVPGAAFSINMADSQTFSPPALTVRVGSTVTWSNQSSTPHTTTAQAGGNQGALPAGAAGWDSGPVEPGRTFSLRFDKAGTYQYVCTFHQGSGMVGTVTVQ